MLRSQRSRWGPRGRKQDCDGCQPAAGNPFPIELMGRGAGSQRLAGWELLQRDPSGSLGVPRVPSRCRRIGVARRTSSTSATGRDGEASVLQVASMRSHIELRTQFVDCERPSGDGSLM